ncbi:MAG: ATP phosphoribosyltransferase regulatory subunit [Thermoanaerobaculia bacterium]
MRISSALPHGVSALLGESARERRRLEALLAEHLQAAGFEEAVLPIVDYLEPYEPLLTPAARRELYQFVDRDGELLALRADFTPMLARLIAPRVDSLSFPLRVYYRGDVVRFQEERPGRLREFYQLGAELVGEAGEAAEESMLRLFLELVTAGYGGSLDVVLGFAGALDRVLDQALDQLGMESPQGAAAGRRDLAAALLRRDREALRRAGAPVLLQVADGGVPEDPQELGPPGERLPGLLELARRLDDEFPGVRISVDLAEFATLSLAEPAGPASGDGADAALGGRPYYDGLVFRAYLGASAQPVGGGGRYDRLFRALGAEVPAVGFSVGLDRLARALEGARRPGGAR